MTDAAAFFKIAIREKYAGDRPARLLDFGCGDGRTVYDLCQLGFDAYGCDICDAWDKELPILDRLYSVALKPYRLPFASNDFDFVISNSVLEHVQNKKESFYEIYRVLKPGGYSFHVYPSKWYLPYEPHIYVPLANYFLSCPKWWFTLWAMLGFRNEFQHDKSWRVIAAENEQYFRNSLFYWTTLQYKQLSLDMFGNWSVPMQFYIDNAGGRLGRLPKKFPFKNAIAIIFRELRWTLLMQQKL